MRACLRDIVMSRCGRCCLAAALLATGVAWRGDVALAQQVAWRTFDSGGGAGSASGTYRLAGTAGQPDAGPPLAAGGFTLRGGFWFGARALGIHLHADGFETGDTTRWDGAQTGLFVTSLSATSPVASVLEIQPGQDEAEGSRSRERSDPQLDGDAPEIPTLHPVSAFLLALSIAAAGTLAVRRRHSAADPTSHLRRRSRQ